MERNLRLMVAVVLVASVGFAAIATLHWPVVGDAPLMHYVAFLIDHGKVPYRDIVDVNLPGTYALESGRQFMGSARAGWDGGRLCS